MTATISLRTVEVRDAPLLRRWSEDEETARLQGARAAQLTECEANSEARRLIAGHGSRHYAYMVEADGVTIGNCWLGHIDGDSASLGIVIGEADYRRRGIGAEVMQQLLHIAAENDIRRVHLWTLATNSGAVRLYRRAGFVETARSVRNVPRSGPVEIVEMAWSAPPF